MALAILINLETAMTERNQTQNNKQYTQNVWI